MGKARRRSPGNRTAARPSSEPERVASEIGSGARPVDIWFMRSTIDRQSDKKKLNPYVS